MNKDLYSRPPKPKTLSVTRRGGAPEKALPELPQIVEVDRYSECHVTPPDVAARMVDYLGPVGDFLTLEPSAGTGNLIAALYESGHSRHELTAIERHYALCKEIRKRFSGSQYIDVIQQCFLEYAQTAQGGIEFPRILMNPPFREVRKHMAAALSLLGNGGHDGCTLVALVPITYQNDEAETLEELDSETFSAAKVFTKIIRIER